MIIVFFIRTEDVALCTDCKAHWGNVTAILDYINKTDLIYRKVTGSNTLVCIKVFLGKTLNPKLLLMCWSAPCIAAIIISVWMYVWITVSRLGQKPLLNALKCECKIMQLRISGFWRPLWTKAAWPPPCVKRSWSGCWWDAEWWCNVSICGFVKLVTEIWAQWD